MRTSLSFVALLACAAPALADDLPYALNAHVTMALPEGWISCDEATGKETANAMPEEKDKPVCDNSAAGHFVMRNGDRSQPSLVLVYFQNNAAFSKSAFATLTADKQKEYAARFCDNASKSLDVPFDSCELTVSMVAGVSAIYGLAKCKPGGGDIVANVRIVALPYDGGLLSFVGAGPEGYPAIDRMVSSFAVH